MGLAFAIAACLVALVASHSGAAPATTRPYALVLGIAQDGGVPQAGCRKACCTSGRHERVASLAIVDRARRRWWLIDATPDFPAQLALVAAQAPACSLA